MGDGRSEVFVIEVDAEHRWVGGDAAIPGLFSRSAPEMIDRPLRDVMPSYRLLEPLLDAAILERRVGRLSAPLGSRRVTVHPLRAGGPARALIVLVEEQPTFVQMMESMGRLAGSIAHDFNNLLGVILACSTFVQEKLPSDSDTYADLDAVITAANRALALTGQLRSFAQQHSRGAA